MADLVIFGTGDIARLAHYYFSTDTNFRVAGFTVDAAYRQGDEFLGLPLVDFETIELRFPPSSYQLFVALNQPNINRLPAEKYARSLDKGYVLATYLRCRCA